MTLYINARWLLDSPTGVQRYAYEMTRALHQQGAPIVLICPKHGEIRSDYHIDGMRVIRYGFGSSHIWEQLILPFFFIGKKDYLLIAFMGLGSILVPHKVMTIHDLSFLHCPTWFSKSYYAYYRIATPLAVRTSKAIITVSEFSKSEIIRFYPWLSPEHIHVIYNAVNTHQFCPSGQPHDTYLLAVASLDPRKNLTRISHAHAGTGIPFFLVGGSGRVFATERDTHTQMQLIGAVGSEQLVAYYQQAQGLVYVSLYEGFGLPPLEAMASDCPVLAADIPVLHEVCGDAAIYCDPTDENDIRRGILQLASLTEEERNDMIQKGRTNIRRFSWQQSAIKLMQLLNL